MKNSDWSFIMDNLVLDLHRLGADIDPSKINFSNIPELVEKELEEACFEERMFLTQCSSYQLRFTPNNVASCGWCGSDLHLEAYDFEKEEYSSHYCFRCDSFTDEDY